MNVCLRRWDLCTCVCILCLRLYLCTYCPCKWLDSLCTDNFLFYMFLYSSKKRNLVQYLIFRNINQIYQNEDIYSKLPMIKFSRICSWVLNVRALDLQYRHFRLDNLDDIVMIFWKIPQHYICLVMSITHRVTIELIICEMSNWPFKCVWPNRTSTRMLP